MELSDRLRRDCEWQQLSENRWIFGVKVRGVVRRYLAQVWRGFETGVWHWITADGAGGGFFESGPLSPGSVGRLGDAITEAEKALGITD